MALTRTRARQIVQLIAAGRVGLGVVASISPGLPLRTWIGPGRRDGGTLLVGRAMGVRDAALGIGALLAVRRGAPLRGWVEAGALADAGDALFTAASFGELPRLGRWAVLAAAVTAAGASLAAAPRVDGGGPAWAGQPVSR